MPDATEDKTVRGLPVSSLTIGSGSLSTVSWKGAFSVGGTSGAETPFPYQVSLTQL